MCVVNYVRHLSKLGLEEFIIYIYNLAFEKFHYISQLSQIGGVSSFPRSIPSGSGALFIFKYAIAFATPPVKFPILVLKNYQELLRVQC